MKQITNMLLCVIFLFSFLQSCQKNNVNVNSNVQTNSSNNAAVTSVITIGGNGSAGFVNGTGANTEFNNPLGLVVDNQNNVFVIDAGNNVIREINSAGMVSTFAGNSISGHVDGTAANAEFEKLSGITVDNDGNLYVSDNYFIRKITPQGNVSTLAGNGISGYLDGIGNSAEFFQPKGLTTDAMGNIYVADATAIREITSAGVVSTVAGDYSNPGYKDCQDRYAEFRGLSGIAVDAQGNLIAGDILNYRIRKIVPLGEVSTLAGNGIKDFANGSSGNAEFIGPSGIAIDGGGNVYVADLGDNFIRKVSATGVVSTFAGNGISGYKDGSAATAEFTGNVGIAVDRQGNVYVADYGSNSIRKISVQ